MDRLIYLFELDSVRKHPDTKCKGVIMTRGVRSVLCEIIKRGNSVALTMNQLTDSQFIREAISDDIAYGCILELFELGVLKVSLYGNIRSASHYIQNAVQKCLDNNGDSFIFSNLPVRSDEYGLLEEIRDALRFSDLSRLQDKAEGAVGEEGQKLKAVYRFVRMILMLSVSETSNIPAKETNAVNVNNKEQKPAFLFFLDEILKVLDLYDFENESFNALVKQALVIIRERDETITDGRINRSNWLDPDAKKGSAGYVANEIIHLCYNYTVEDSINGASKHYDDNDFAHTFKNDLVSRMKLYCLDDREEAGGKRLRAVSRAKWRAAVRFARYATDDERRKESQITDKAYEEDFHGEKLRWLGLIFRKNLGALIMAIVYIAVFCVVELGISWLEDAFSLPLNNLIASSVLSVILLGLLGSGIGYLLKIINKGDEVPDILQSVEDIFIHIWDFISAFGGYDDSYRLS